VTPRQLVRIAGERLPARYRRRLERFRYGPGAHKVDWALSGPIPWKDPAVARAGTVHLGGTFEELAAAERAPWEGRHAAKPYVLLVQASLFDDTRAPAGKHTAWAYCHVPHGSTVDVTDSIESQIERFAPGFRDLILAKSVMGTADLERHNPNLIGGDITGGAQILRQVLARPVVSMNPYRTPGKGIYLCSSSTPPGGGVHGMCGYHAARMALHDLF
jgi:phytoene dehydrogenase-like protein